MNKQNESTLRNATAKALAAQVKRTLDVARIKGYVFPENCDIGVLVLSSSPLVLKVKARMDDVSIEATIANETATADIAKMVDDLVVPWLVKNATVKPAKTVRL